jgi:hypothetical protein
LPTFPCAGKGGAIAGVVATCLAVTLTAFNGPFHP